MESFVGMCMRWGARYSLVFVSSCTPIRLWEGHCSSQKAQNGYCYDQTFFRLLYGKGEQIAGLERFLNRLFNIPYYKEQN